MQEIETEPVSRLSQFYFINLISDTEITKYVTKDDETANIINKAGN